MAAREGKFLSHFYPTQRAKRRRNRENIVLKTPLNQYINRKLLTIHDICKAVDRGMRIDNVRLIEKKGGKSGHWSAE